MQKRKRVHSRIRAIVTDVSQRHHADMPDIVLGCHGNIQRTYVESQVASSDMIKTKWPKCYDSDILGRGY